MKLALVSPEIEAYAEQFSSPELPALAALNKETQEHIPRAQMLSGHLQGSFLQMICQMVRPKRVLEIGTFTGYSAICLAHGLTNGGELHTIDADPALKEIASRAITAAGLADKIIQHIGIAIEIIPTLGGMFDLVFIDANKSGYPHYYDMVFDRVPVGGYIISDNVLFKGEVVLPAEEQSKPAKHMHRYNEKVHNDPRVEHLLLPLRDGLMIARKIRD